MNAEAHLHARAGVAFVVSFRQQWVALRLAVQAQRAR